MKIWIFDPKTHLLSFASVEQAYFRRFTLGSNTNVSLIANETGTQK